MKPALKPVLGRRDGDSYWAGLALDVLKSHEALCGLTFVLVVLTICALALHEYGIDVMPRARAAQIESISQTPHP